MKIEEIWNVIWKMKNTNDEKIWNEVMNEVINEQYNEEIVMRERKIEYVWMRMTKILFNIMIICNKM